eukprot:UN10237
MLKCNTQHLERNLTDKADFLVGDRHKSHAYPCLGINTGGGMKMFSQTTSILQYLGANLDSTGYD